VAGRVFLPGLLLPGNIESTKEEPQISQRSSGAHKAFLDHAVDSKIVDKYQTKCIIYTKLNTWASAGGGRPGDNQWGPSETREPSEVAYRPQENKYSLFWLQCRCYEGVRSALKISVMHITDN